MLLLYKIALAIMFAVVVKAQSWNCPPTGIHNLPHPYSCSSWILCINGNGVLMNCTEGTYFDPDLETCNIGGIVNCEPCLAHDPNEITFIPSSTDCSRYYVCIANELYTRYCAPGLYFHPERLVCISAENVDCPHSEAAPPPPPQPPSLIEIECPPSEPFELEFLPHPESCQHYFICSEGQSHLRHCMDGLIYDVISESCNFPENGNCILDSNAGCPATGVQFMPHSLHCRHYWLCVNGEQILRTCSPLLLFDSNLLNCVIRDEALCA